MSGITVNSFPDDTVAENVDGCRSVAAGGLNNKAAGVGSVKVNLFKVGAARKNNLTTIVGADKVKHAQLIAIGKIDSGKSVRSGNEFADACAGKVEIAVKLNKDGGGAAVGVVVIGVIEAQTANGGLRIEGT